MSSGLLTWARSVLDEDALADFKAGRGDVATLPSDVDDVMIDHEAEIDELIADEASEFDWDNPQGYVLDKYSAEMEEGAVDEVHRFAIRCALERLLMPR